ncbi:hypothetical protein [Pedobacter sp. V48]|uniref:hypothetical protein n=1 Tax=Pedobacter sp. V48 TaxID=509635 RepID=UPI0003E57DD3|nr:hypothetical protein [Pedobacter sp. V48]ETZ20151.1 hypothetical protein N824_08030 [Pedobacter sp. V48]
MLKAFSWQDFLLAATIMSLLWWLGIWLLYFRKPVVGASLPLSHSWANEVDELGAADLMGKPALDSGVSVVEADDFSFGAPLADEGAPDQEEQLGDLADVQEEIKTVCRILAAEDGTKEDFFSLFEMIRNKYPRITSSPSLAALNGFIREHVPFALSKEELENLWV